MSEKRDSDSFEVASSIPDQPRLSTHTWTRLSIPLKYSTFLYLPHPLDKSTWLKSVPTSDAQDRLILRVH